MQFSFCLILLSSIVVVEYSLANNDIEYIQCTSRCQQFTVSFTDPLAFPLECQENNETSNNYDRALACGVEYTLNYDTETVSIDFTADNDTGSLENQKPSSFLVQTMQLSLSQHRTQPNIVVRRYGCNSANDCARKFYIDSINYLINEGKTQINSIKLKLHNDSFIIGPKSRRYCIDSSLTGDRPSVKCPNGLCYFRSSQYQLDEQRNEKIQNCQGIVAPTLRSEIEQHSPPSTQKDRSLLEYTCNKHVCNRDELVHRIQELVGEIKNANLDVENIVNEKKTNNSICQTISSVILVLFLFLFQLFI